MSNLTPDKLHSVYQNYGLLLKSFAISQLRGQASLLDDPTYLSHYRNKNHVKVDLVIEHVRDVYDVEEKASSNQT